ncbi:methyltransferase SirN-like protein [Phaeosphaeriaceae sp. PMI808]|nr:methyltransferase SirN-like protein [Phaeosphaeriaceae sp. PMI808]
MDNFMDMTKKSGHTPELQRLQGLHAALMDSMDQNLICAPIDFKESGKRILDSGTADGIWLRDTRRTVLNGEQHEYFSSDIEVELFPENPDGITYFGHSFKDPWPVEYRGSMDLVHVRGSLAASSPSPIQVVKNLVSLVKPGGWVQLMEMNAFSGPENGPAMNDFAHMAQDVWTAIKVGDFANNLKNLLEEAGLKNVQERRYLVNIGKTAKPDLQGQSTLGVSGPVAPIASVAKSVQTSFTEEELTSLPARVKTELENRGAVIEEIVAWGQRI